MVDTATAACAGPGSCPTLRLQRLAESVCAQAGRLGPAGVSVRLLLPVHPAGPGGPPIREELEVFGTGLATACEQLQTRLRQGPRILAIRACRALVIPHFGREQRWPVFRATAVSRHGLAAVQVEPLLVGGGPALGAVAWWTDRPTCLGTPAAIAHRHAYAATVARAVLAELRDPGD